MSEPLSTPPHSAATFLEHAHWVRKLAGELVRDPQGADDVAQNTWLAFLKQRPKVGAPLRPWLARVVRNQAALRARRRGNLRHREETVAREESTASAASVVERGEVQKQIISCVLALGEPYRSVLLLHYYENLSSQEIARIRGQKASTVRSQLTRGRELLRTHLDAEYGGERERWVRRVAPLIPFGLERRGVPFQTRGAFIAAASGAVVLGALALSQRSSEGGAPGVGGPPLHDVSVGAVQPVEPITGDSLAAREPRGADSVPVERAVMLVDGAGRALGNLTLELDGSSATTDTGGRLLVGEGRHTLELRPDEGAGVSRVAGHGARRTEPSEALRIELAPDATEVVVALGPMLSVEIAAAPDVRLDGAALFARLGPVNGTAYADHGQPIYIAPLVPGAPAIHAVRQVYTARFGAEAAALLGLASDLLLEVRDAEGLIAGSTEITLDAETSAVRHPVPVVSTARVDFLLETPGGEVPRETREASFVCLTTEIGQAVGFSTGDAAGDIWVGWVQPGTYSVIATVPGFEPWRGSIECSAGERTELVAELEPMGIAPGLEGVIAASGADFDEQLLVFLMDDEGQVCGVDPLSWRDKSGARVAAFSFSEPPPGPLVVEVVSLGSAVTVQQGGPQPVPDPRAPILMELNDANAARDVVVVVTDARTGDPIEGFDLRASLNGGMTRRFVHRLDGDKSTWTLHAGSMRWNDFEGPAPLRRLPRGTTVQWAIEVDGFESKMGSEIDFAEHPDGFSELRVVLERP